MPDDLASPSIAMRSVTEIPAAPRGFAETPSAATAPPSRGVKRFLLPLALLGAIVAAATYGWDWYVEGRFIVTTDDAYVRADTAVIAAKVSGYVASVAAADNQQVHAGDLLARIDDGDYRLAVEAAQRRIDTQDATIARIRQQANAQRAVIEQTDAQISASRADEQRAASDYERATRTLQSGSGTAQRLDSALADRDRTVAAVRNAEAAKSAAQANLGVLDAQRVEAEQARSELVTALDRAKRDLSFAEIRAPFDGVVGNRAIQVGQLVQPGSRLLSLVPTQSAFIEANFKETQLTRMKAGQKVSVHVDALPGRIIEGTVESVSPASGAQFSLLPPENATGNFTKIVQRVPVRIRVPASVAAEGVLRPGLSVTADVDTWPDDQTRPTLLGALGLGGGRR